MCLFGSFPAEPESQDLAVLEKNFRRHRTAFSASGNFAPWPSQTGLLLIPNFVTPLSLMVLSSLGPSTPARHAVTGKADLPLAFAQDDGFLKESLSQRSPKGL